MAPSHRWEPAADTPPCMSHSHSRANARIALASFLAHLQRPAAAAPPQARLRPTVKKQKLFFICLAPTILPASRESVAWNNTWLVSRGKANNRSALPLLRTGFHVKWPVGGGGSRFPRSNFTGREVGRTVACSRVALNQWVLTALACLLAAEHCCCRSGLEKSTLPLYLKRGKEGRSVAREEASKQESGRKQTAGATQIQGIRYRPTPRRTLFYCFRAAAPGYL